MSRANPHASNLMTMMSRASLILMNTYAEVDEDDYMVRLWLQDLKHVPSIDDVESEVYVDFEESLELEEALEELGGYSRIRKFFGTSQRD